MQIKHVEVLGLWMFLFSTLSSLHTIFWNLNNKSLLVDGTNTWVQACMLSCFSHVWLFENPWTVACQAPLSMGVSRQEYWSGLPCPPPGGSPWPRGQTPVSYLLRLLNWKAGSLPLVAPGKPIYIHIPYIYINIYMKGNVQDCFMYHFESCQKINIMNFLFKDNFVRSIVHDFYIHYFNSFSHIPPI